MPSVVSNWCRIILSFAYMNCLLVGCGQPLLEGEQLQDHIEINQNRVVVKGVHDKVNHVASVMTDMQAKAALPKVQLLKSSVVIKGGKTIRVAYKGRPLGVSASSYHLNNITLQPGELVLTAKEQSGTEEVVFEFNMEGGLISKLRLNVTVQGSQPSVALQYKWYPESKRKATQEEREVLRLTNLVRKKGTRCGDKFYPAVPALTWNDTLAHSARNHAIDMGKRGYFDHNTSEGVEFSERMTAAGYSWKSAGENIAAGQPTPKQVVDAWVKSKGHCTNLMSADFKELGVGMTKQAGSMYGIYWGQNFGMTK